MNAQLPNQPLNISPTTTDTHTHGHAHAPSLPLSPYYLANIVGFSKGRNQMPLSPWISQIYCAPLLTILFPICLVQVGRRRSFQYHNVFYVFLSSPHMWTHAIVFCNGAEQRWSLFPPQVETFIANRFSPSEYKSVSYIHHVSSRSHSEVSPGAIHIIATAGLEVEVCTSLSFLTR